MASNNAYSAYEEAIARAKSALESYSAETEALARLYETAKQNAQSAYEAQKQQTAEQAKEARRMADVDMQRTERNLDQRLASRGLAFSGENAQTRLDLLLALRNRLSGIDSDERAQYASLDQALADRQHELDLAYASSRTDAAKQLASLNADLAAAEANKASAEEAAKAAAAAAAAASKPADKTDSAASTKPPTVHHSVQKPGSAASGAGTGAGGSGSGSEGESASGVTPSISAQNLAKQMVTAVGGNGRISTATQQANMAALLDSLLATTTFDSAYYEELMLNLRSLGFRPDYAEQSAESGEQLQKSAADYYDKHYKRYFGVYRNAGYSVTEADRRASEQARYEQLRYLYTHSLSKDLFDAAVEELSLGTYVDGFYSRLAQEDKNLRLGSEAR